MKKNINISEEMEHPAFFRKIPREVKKMHPTCACEPLRLTNVNSLLIGYILGVLIATII